VNRGVVGGVVAGVVVGLGIAGLALVAGDDGDAGDDGVTVVDPGSAAGTDGLEVVTNWTGLVVSPDRRTVSVSTALPLDPCAEVDRLVLEIRPDEGVVVVLPTFVVPRVGDDEDCVSECTAIEMSATAAEPIPADYTFVSSPDAVTTCAEGIPIET
jgi:hypothetical protein